MSSVDSLLIILIMSSFAASQNTTMSTDGMLMTDVTSFVPLTVGRFIILMFHCHYEFRFILLLSYWLYFAYPQINATTLAYELGLTENG